MFGKIRKKWETQNKKGNIVMYVPFAFNTNEKKKKKPKHARHSLSITPLLTLDHVFYVHYT